MGEGRGEETTYRASRGLSLASPVWMPKESSVRIHILARGDLSRLCAFVEEVWATCRYQRNQETDKRAGIVYLDQIRSEEHTSELQSRE